MTWIDHLDCKVDGIYVFVSGQKALRTTTLENLKIFWICCWKIVELCSLFHVTLLETVHLYPLRTLTSN
jgi:hypothetical protein